jgi:hypothetical protein
MSDLRSVCEGSPQFQELSSLAAQYREDIRNFRALQELLEASVKGNVRTTVDLGAELARCQVLNRHRLERCIAAPIAKETEDFVRRVCVVLRQTETPRHTSQKVARHGIHEFKLIPDAANIISRAVVEAVLLAGGDARGTIADRVVSELDALWTDVCLPIIEGERKSLESELPATRKLAAFVVRLVQMKQNGRPPETVHATAKSEFCGVAHTLHRVSIDDWYTASRVSVCDLGACCASEYDADVGKRMVDWLEHAAGAFHDALIADCASIEALRTTSEFAPEWHGLRISDSADDPATAALIEPPQYVGAFNSQTGRIYALPSAPIHGSSSLRTVGVVRTLHVIRSLVANGMFSLGKFAAAYAKELVDREQQVITCKTSGILSNLLMLCQDFNFPADAVAIDRFVDGLVRQRTGRASAPGHASGDASGDHAQHAATFAGCCAVPPSSRAAHASAGRLTSSSGASSASSSASVETTVAVQPALRSGHHGRDFFVRPEAKHKTIDFWPSRVARTSLLEYLVVYSLATMINEILSGSRMTFDIAAVGLSNSSIVDRVASNMQRLYRTEGSPLGRLMIEAAQAATSADNASDHADGGCSTTINRMALKQMVSFTVKKVLRTGAEGTLAAQRIAAPNAMTFVASYKPTRATNELLLHVGSGARDPACYLFLDLCVRIKSWLDESWPLAEGMTWAKAQPRRGTGARGKAAVAAAVA